MEVLEGGYAGTVSRVPRMVPMGILLTRLGRPSMPPPIARNGQNPLRRLAFHSRLRGATYQKRLVPSPSNARQFSQTCSEPVKSLPGGTQVKERFQPRITQT